jgi:hypothetical protein
MKRKGKNMYTKGPWSFGKESREIYACKESEKAGKTICRMNPPYEGYSPRWSDDSGENEANACLITAAPDLLKACKAIEDAWETNENHPLEHRPEDCDLCEMILNVKAAISKAEGRKD